MIGLAISYFCTCHCRLRNLMTLSSAMHFPGRMFVYELNFLVYELFFLVIAFFSLIYFNFLFGR